MGTSGLLTMQPRSPLLELLQDKVKLPGPLEVDTELEALEIVTNKLKVSLLIPLYKMRGSTTALRLSSRAAEGKKLNSTLLNQ